MPTDLSPPRTGYAAGSASRKCHARSDCKDRSDPSEDTALSAGKILVSRSGSHGINGTPNRGWASGGLESGGLESGGDQSGRAKSRPRGRFGVPTTGANGNFVDWVHAREDSGHRHEERI